jgi:hypothetical protein
MTAGRYGAARRQPISRPLVDFLPDELEAAGEPARQRRRRAVPLDPTNPKTWQEVADLQPRLKERLRLGGWYAYHVRKQGDRSHGLGRRPGIIEAVPASASSGVLDWFCVPANPSGAARADQPLWIELKTERGKLTDDQALWALYAARAGLEVAVLRPRHFVYGMPDIVYRRLVLHEINPMLFLGQGDDERMAWDQVLVKSSMGITDVLRL